MAFPGAKVHRSSRRTLGKGQHPQVPSATITPTVSGATLTLTSDVPLVVSGPFPVACTGTGAATFVSQTQVSATVYTQLFSTALTTAMTLAMADSPGNVATTQGGAVRGFSVPG